MEHVISNLLKSYEKGSLSRRELVQGLAMLAVAARSASAAPAGFAATTINHVSIQVSDLKRSTEFYKTTFGLPVRVADRPDVAVRLGVGKSHLTLRQAKPSGLVDHFCMGVDGFNHDSVVRELKERGVNSEPDEHGFSAFHVKDPDGLDVQLEDSSAF